jgi:hypothetical protein
MGTAAALLTWACFLSQVQRKVYVAVLGNGGGPAEFIEAYTGKAMKNKVVGVPLARTFDVPHSFPCTVAAARVGSHIPTRQHVNV